MEQMKEEIVAATHQKPGGSLCTKFDILIKSVLGKKDLKAFYYPNM